MQPGFEKVPRTSDLGLATVPHTPSGLQNMSRPRTLTLRICPITPSWTSKSVPYLHGSFQRVSQHPHAGPQEVSQNPLLVSRKCPDPPIGSSGNVPGVHLFSKSIHSHAVVCWSRKVIIVTKLCTLNAFLASFAVYIPKDSSRHLDSFPLLIARERAASAGLYSSRLVTAPINLPSHHRLL